MRWRVDPNCWLLHACGAVVGVALASLVATASPQVQSTPLPPFRGNTQAPPTAVLPKASLSLPELLSLAVENHPDLAVAHARAEAARGRLVQAGLYPNILVTARFDELGHVDNGAGNPGVALTQEIVTAGKLRLAQAAAAQGVQAADWQAMTRWFDVAARVRIAFYEYLTAQRDVKTNTELVEIAQRGLEVANKLLNAGTGTRPDVLRAQVEFEQSKIRQSVAERRREAAERLLATAVGVRSFAGMCQSPLVVEGSLEETPPLYAWEPLLETVLTRSSEVQEAQALALQAEQLAQRAIAERIPNVTVTARPYYAAPQQDTRVLVEVGAPIPFWNRNQGNIMAARADAARANAEVRQVELRLTERLTLAYQRYQAAQGQVEAFQKQILPNARESLRLILLGYEKGDAKYDYNAVLLSQQALAQVNLTYVQALGELWRAIAELRGLLQE